LPSPTQGPLGREEGLAFPWTRPGAPIALFLLFTDVIVQALGGGKPGAFPRDAALMSNGRGAGKRREPLPSDAPVALMLSVKGLQRNISLRT
jgi:hypothetical protein